MRQKEGENLHWIEGQNRFWNLYSLMRFGFVAGGCSLLNINVDVVLSSCYWEVCAVYISVQ